MFSFFGQYAYSILSIISGLVALLVTCIVTFLSSIISLTRLDIQKIPISYVSSLFEPAFGAFCAALMVDHDNTNPIKFMVTEWFCNRLQSIRKDEVRRRWYSHTCYFVCMPLRVKIRTAHRCSFWKLIYCSNALLGIRVFFLGPFVMILL